MPQCPFPFPSPSSVERPHHVGGVEHRHAGAVLRHRVTGSHAVQRLLRLVRDHLLLLHVPRVRARPTQHTTHLEPSLTHQCSSPSPDQRLRDRVTAGVTLTTHHPPFFFFLFIYYSYAYFFIYLFTPQLSLLLTCSKERVETSGRTVPPRATGAPRTPSG